MFPSQASLQDPGADVFQLSPRTGSGSDLRAASSPPSEPSSLFAGQLADLPPSISEQLLGSLSEPWGRQDEEFVMIEDVVIVDEEDHEGRSK